MSWTDDLLPASWRGLGFGVVAARTRKGRRVAVHEYPDRDVLWVEDLGRDKRGYQFTGFLSGDDVQWQRAAFDAACETPGPGPLVHPSLGTLTVALVSYEIGESIEGGNTIELLLTFLETAPAAAYPAVGIAPGALVVSSAAALAIAAAADFASDVASALLVGADVVGSVGSALAGWTALAASGVQGATRLLRLVTGLVAPVGYEYGRYSVGNRASPQPASATVASLTAEGVAERVAIAAAIATAATAAASVSGTNPATIAALSAAVQAVADEVQTVGSDPGDQITLLVVLAGYAPAPSAATDAIGTAMTTAGAAVGALCRRCALVDLAQAAAEYQPTSYDDAQAVLVQIASAFDAEIGVAGDTGDDGSFFALSALRTAVVQALLASGGDLAPLMTVNTAVSLPACTLAYQLYRDADRDSELVAESGADHPCFLPTTLQALAY